MEQTEKTRNMDNEVIAYTVLLVTYSVFASWFLISLYRDSTVSQDNRYTFVQNKKIIVIYQNCTFLEKEKLSGNINLEINACSSHYDSR